MRDQLAQMQMMGQTMADQRPMQHQSIQLPRLLPPGAMTSPQLAATWGGWQPMAAPSPPPQQQFQSLGNTTVNSVLAQELAEKRREVAALREKHHELEAPHRLSCSSNPSPNPNSRTFRPRSHRTKSRRISSSSGAAALRGALRRCGRKIYLSGEEA